MNKNLLNNLKRMEAYHEARNTTPPEDFAEPIEIEDDEELEDEYSDQTNDQKKRIHR